MNLSLPNAYVLSQALAINWDENVTSGSFVFAGHPGAWKCTFKEDDGKAFVATYFENVCVRLLSQIPCKSMFFSQFYDQTLFIYGSKLK